MTSPLPPNGYSYALPLDTFAGQQAALYYLERVGAGRHTDPKARPQEHAALRALVNKHSIDRLLVAYDGTDCERIHYAGGDAMENEGENGEDIEIPDMTPEERATLRAGLLVFDGHFTIDYWQSFEMEWDASVDYRGTWRMATLDDLTELDIDVDEWAVHVDGVCDVDLVAAGVCAQFPEHSTLRPGTPELHAHDDIILP